MTKSVPPSMSPPGDERTVIIRRETRFGLAPGTLLGNTYRIEALLARGGMGEVYRATHIELATTHAIKVILPSLANDPKMVQMLVEEARKLARLRHDAIVAYEGLFRSENGLRYLVMEFIEGESLAELLRHRRLEPSEVLRLGARLAQGLAVAHGQGIIHRDISPENIIVPQGDVDRAKLIDFGISHWLDTETTRVNADFSGKYGYASPEQMGLFDGAVDLRSDIYSLGLVLANSAIGFGKQLDMGTSPTSMIAARERLPDLSPVPAELRPVIAPMLAPKPEDRLPSMQALLPAAAPVPPAARAPARRGALFGAVVLVVALLAVAAFLFRGVLWPPPVETVRAQLNELAAGFGCAAIASSIAEDRSVRVDGHVATSADLERLRRAVSDLPGTGRLAFDVGVMIWPYCEVVRVLQPFTGKPAPNDPTVAPESEPHTGERLTLATGMPNFDGYVYVDYFVGEGHVLHLLPNGRDVLNLKPAYNHFVLGKPPMLTCWTLGSGAGEQLVSVVVADGALFPGRRPEVESAKDYLASLSQAVGKARQVAAATLFFNLTKPPRPNPAAACPLG